MIGTPPSRRISWPDSAAHARDFARRYSDLVNYHVESRMMELGLPTGESGSPTRIKAVYGTRSSRMRGKVAWYSARGSASIAVSSIPTC